MDPNSASLYHRHLNDRYYYVNSKDDHELLFTENETNFQRLYGSENPSPYVKDSINDCVIQQNIELVNPKNEVIFVFKII